MAGSDAFESGEALAILERTPATFRALLEGLPDAWVRAREGPDTFSALDNLGHLIQGERTDWIVRARIILAGDPEQRFEPFDRFAHVRAAAGRSVSELLDELEQLRARNLATLKEWNPDESKLDLQATHPALGRVTLRQLIATWAAHDLGHIAQTARVMAKRYREAVGPWREYLPILDR
jgi:hypothetical protein